MGHSSRNEQKMTRKRTPRTPEQRHREYRLWKARETPERRTIRLAKQRERNALRARTETSIERLKRNERNREYQRARTANKVERRKADRQCLKPYAARTRDRIMANYAARGLAISQRMLDELNGKRDPHTPPLFRRV